jgi:protoheme IX farnesyltransferase
MIGLVFSLWQMPHAYAIALYRRREYAAAGIPLMPALQEMPAGKQVIIVYILIFAVAALMPTFGGYTGYGYLAVTAAMSLIWLTLALAGPGRIGERLWAKQLFVFSLVTIAVLSVMMATDVTVASQGGVASALG